MERDRAPPAERPGAGGGHPRQLPRLRAPRAGRGDARPLRALHVPPRHLARPGRAHSDGSHAAHPRGPRGSGGGVPQGPAAAAQRRGGVRVPRGRDQLLLHGALPDARHGRPGPGDGGPGGAGGDLGLAARLVRRRPRRTRQAAAPEPHARASRRRLLRRARDHRPRRGPGRVDRPARRAAHRAARGAAAAAAPPPAAG